MFFVQCQDYQTANKSNTNKENTEKSEMKANSLNSKVEYVSKFLPGEIFKAETQILCSGTRLQSPDSCKEKDTEYPCET